MADPVTERRVLLPGLTLPVDDYAALVSSLPGSTVVLDTLSIPVTAPVDELRAAVAMPEAPYALVGHSIGALAALEWAVLYPAEVSRVVLLDPSDPFGQPVPNAIGGPAGRALAGLVGMLARSPRIARILGRWGRRTVLEGYGVEDDPLSRARVDELFGSRRSLGVVTAQLVGVPAQVARVRRLLDGGLGATPVIVLGSSIADETTDRLAALLGTTVIPVLGGHLFPMTHPSATAEAIAGNR